MGEVSLKKYKHTCSWSDQLIIVPTKSYADVYGTNGYDYCHFSKFLCDDFSSCWQYWQGQTVGNGFGVLCFLETPVLRFALLHCYWRNIIQTTEISLEDKNHCNKGYLSLAQPFDPYTSTHNSLIKINNIVVNALSSSPTVHILILSYNKKIKLKSFPFEIRFSDPKFVWKMN